jgi:hypothetical protein
VIKEFEHYLKKRGVQGPWFLELQKRVYTFILVVPVMNELESLPLLLKSIEKQEESLLRKTLVLVVINNGPEAKPSVLKNNQDLHELLKSQILPYSLGVIDAYNEEFCLPHKHAGVGLARKIGMDLGLKYANESTVFGCLDADVVLSPKYLNRMQKLKDNGVSAAVLSFEHQSVQKEETNFLDQADFENSQKAIKDYENFLKHTAIELAKIESPYGYVPLGSAMMCTAKAYVAIGGMSKKKAAEDFYFLQALAKYCGVQSEVFEAPIVFPSARESSRAYLGTGYRMIKVREGFEMKSLEYSKEAFEKVGFFLDLALKSKNISWIELSLKIKENSSLLLKALEGEGMGAVWDGFRSFKHEKQFVGQFQKWFDALKTLRCLKALS